MVRSFICVPDNVTNGLVEPTRPPRFDLLCLAGSLDTEDLMPLKKRIHLIAKFFKTVLHATPCASAIPVEDLRLEHSGSSHPLSSRLSVYRWQPLPHPLWPAAI